MEARTRSAPSEGQMEPVGATPTGSDFSTSLSSGTTLPPNPAVDSPPTRFYGSVMISSERPARDIHQIVEAIVEQLTTLPGSDVRLRLEIDAQVPGGLDRAKVRTLLENSTTLGFIDRKID